MKHVFYCCNPEKNTDCSKQYCYLNPDAEFKNATCNATSKIKCAMKDTNGNPIISGEYIDFMSDGRAVLKDGCLETLCYTRCSPVILCIERQLL